MKKMKRIHLISSPRNISTAFMYSFANRSDTKVVDEPFYAYYLDLTGKDHPEKEATLASMPKDPQTVIHNCLQGKYESEIVFFKNMAHHIIGMELSFLNDLDNLFLIRDPKQLIASFAQVISNPTMEDIGSKRQFELFNHLSNIGKQPIVVDSNELLKDPEKVLKELCNRLDISFNENMLKWSKGPIKEDGVWASYWYKNVHETTGFSKQTTSTRELADELLPLYESAKPYYDHLYKHAIKA